MADKKVIVEDYVKDIEHLSEMLVNFLEECNVTLTIKEKEQSFKKLLERLPEIIAIRKDKSYLGVETDDNGYIISLLGIDGILEQQELPVDITAGYYKYEKGNFILDEKMKLERR
jgi:hypothetical protein